MTPAMFTWNWDNLPYTGTAKKERLRVDYQVSIPHEISGGRAAAVVARKPRTFRPVPVTRRVNVHPMTQSDTLWRIYPTAEFFNVCETECVMASNGPTRVFWHYYHQKYPGRSFETFQKHDIHYDVARMIKNMYLTHKKRVGRCRQLTFNTALGKAYVSVDVLKHHLLSVRGERKNKHKLQFLKSKYPSIYGGITLQSFTYHLWRLNNPQKLHKKLKRCVTKRYRRSDIDACLADLRKTNLKSFLDWWPSVAESVKQPTRMCTKAMWPRFTAQLKQKKIDASPWSFRRFLYCVQCACKTNKPSFSSPCAGNKCKHQCKFSVRVSPPTTTNASSEI